MNLVNKSESKHYAIQVYMGMES